MQVLKLVFDSPFNNTVSQDQVITQNLLAALSVDILAVHFLKHICK